MVRLAMVFGFFGLMLGVVSAVIHYYLPIKYVGWFAYTPLSGNDLDPVLFQSTWLPSIVLVPSVGLLLGVGTALALALTRWRLVRVTSPDTSKS